MVNTRASTFMAKSQPSSVNSHRYGGFPAPASQWTLRGNPASVQTNGPGRPSKIVASTSLPRSPDSPLSAAESTKTMLFPHLATAVLVAAALSAGPIAAQDGSDFGLTMTRLELSLDLDHDEGSLQGWASYRIVNASDRSVADLSFNLGRLLTVDRVETPTGEPLDFTQRVAVFTDSRRRQVNHVVVTLQEPLASGATAEVKISYGGFLVPYTETGSVYIKDRVVWNAVARYLEDGRFSILRADAYAWPVPGTLSQRVNRGAPRRDFTVRARISVPEPFVVASGSRLVEESSREGRTTFVYESADPVPFLNLPIAEYSVSRAPGVRVYHFPQDSVGAADVMRKVTEGLALLEQWFGPLGVTPDLAVMEIPEMWGSQASLTGGIIQTADAFGEAASRSALYHELSHLWNARDTDLPSARWNEGLATFLAARMAAILDGSDVMENDVQRTADRLLTAASESSELSSVPFSRYGEDGMTDYSYRVGLLMFYGLESALGPDAFNAFLRSFFQDSRSSGWTFAELANRLRNYPGANLDRFVHDWIESTEWLSLLRAGVPPADVGFGGR